SYSCANSRLFRTVLYADPELAAWLEDNFVLHWSSERPVPQLAIDFGDGRVVRRTITGNSAHFVLDGEGRVVDVLPGLWSPVAFRQALESSLALHGALAPLEDDDRLAALAVLHETRFEADAARLGDEMARIRRRPDPEALRAWLRSPPGDGSRVAAVEAVPMAIGKAKIEAPILGAATRELGGRPSQRFVSPGPADDLERLMIGQRLAAIDELPASSLAIIAGEQPLDALIPASEREEAMARLVAGLLESIRQDTAKNALELAPRVHSELARRAREGEALDFESVDRWLYAELFQTPADDPWLGLIDPTIYTGLPDGGLKP
ncbi:MAG: hypothetical protein KC457_30870, partial [Myxococcales bacterium]|nr:hypothetical protein [Myxococcales bacterium]